MESSIERLLSTRVCGLLATIIGPLITACVGTDLAHVDSGLPCAKAETAPVSAESLVWLRVDLGETGYRYCSGVAISPALVATSSTCVAYPADGDYGEEAVAVAGSMFPRDRSTYFDPAEYDEFCDRADNWSALENGSFRSRLGEPVPEEALGVGLQGESDPTLAVERLIVAATNSRCTDGVAVLLLAERLDVPDVPLRFVDVDEVGEPVLLSGLIGERGRFVRRDLQSQVERVTLQTGDDAAPPRSLLLSSSVCPFDRGAPVFSEESGALIAVVAWGQGGACEQSVDGNTVATRLAPFREVLLQAAETYGQPLFSELRPGPESNRQLCGTGSGRAGQVAP